MAYFGCPGLIENHVWTFFINRNSEILKLFLILWQNQSIKGKNFFTNKFDFCGLIWRRQLWKHISRGPPIYFYFLFRPSLFALSNGEDMPDKNMLPQKPKITNLHISGGIREKHRQTSRQRNHPATPINFQDVGLWWGHYKMHSVGVLLYPHIPPFHLGHEVWFWNISDQIRW